MIQSFRFVCSRLFLLLSLFTSVHWLYGSFEIKSDWGFDNSVSGAKSIHFTDTTFIPTTLAHNGGNRIAVGGQLEDKGIIQIFEDGKDGPALLFSDKDSLSNSCVSKIVWSDSDTLVTGFEFFSQDDFDQRVGIRVFKDEKVLNSIDQIDDANQLVDLRADPTDSNIIWVLTANSASKGKLSRLSISTNVIEPILDNLDSPQAFALSEDSLCVIETAGRRNSKLSFHAKEKSKGNSNSRVLQNVLISDLDFSAESNSFIVVGRELGSQEVGQDSKLEDFFMASFSPTSKGEPKGNWKVTAGSDENREWGKSISVLPNGQLLITGNFFNRMTLSSAQEITPRNNRLLAASEGDDFESFLALYDHNGSLAWVQTSGFLGNDFGVDLSPANKDVILLGTSKQTDGFGPYLIKSGLSGDQNRIAPPAALEDSEDAPIFWETPESIRLGEPVTFEYLSSRTINSQDGSFVYNLEDEDGNKQSDLQVNDLPFFKPGPLILSASIGKSSAQKTIEGRKGRLYLEASFAMSGSFDPANGQLPKFQIITEISGAHPKKSPGKVSFEVLEGNGTMDGQFYVPTGIGKVEILCRIEENEFYEESSRTITFFVAPGDGGKSNELERFSVVVEDLQGVHTIGPVPKGRAITISASLGFGSQKAFERWVEFSNGTLTTARVKSPFSSKTSVVVEENLNLLAKYKFSFIGSAVNGYLEDSTVFLDFNFDGVHDVDEPIGYADTGGQFRLEFSEELGQIIDKNQNGRIDSDEARLVIVGGRDTASGLDLSLSYKAPPSYSVITSITTLVSELIQNGNSLDQSEKLVSEALGLPEGIEIGNFEPLLSTHSDHKSAKIFVDQATRLANLLNEGGRYLQTISANKISRSDAADLIFSYLAENISTNTTLDISSNKAISTILGSLSNSGTTSSNLSDSSSFSSARSLLNLSFDDLSSGTNEAHKTQVAQLISSVNLKLGELANESDSSPYLFKAQAANLQSLIDSEGTNLAMMLSEAEVAKLSEIANSETENLSENAQEILSMSVVGFKDEISLDLSNVSTDLPNAFAPFLTTNSLEAPGAVNDTLKIGSLNAIDPEEQKVFFAIVDNNPDLDGDGIPALAISSTSGELEVVDFDDLQFMDEDSLRPIIRVSDPGGLYSDEMVEVNLREWSFKSGRPRDALVRTKAAENVTSVSATLAGEVLSEGGELPWRKGFEISTDISFSEFIEVESFGPQSNFTFDAWSLQWDTVYYFRSFADNAKGRSHGNKKRFKTKENTFEGIYKDAVELGSGWWEFWFGYAFAAEGGWFFHWDVGWVFLVAQDDDQVWFYFPNHGWMWVSRSYYPYYYDYSDSRWLYLIFADDKVAKFIHYETSKIFTLEK